MNKQRNLRLLLGAMPGCGQSPELEFAVVLTVILEKSVRSTPKAHTTVLISISPVHMRAVGVLLGERRM